MRVSVLLGEMALLAALPTEAQGCDVTFKDISAAYQKKYERIETIRVDTVRVIEPVIPEVELFHQFNRLPPLPITVTVIAHQDGRLFYKEANPWSVVSRPLREKLAKSYPEVQDDFSKVFDLPYQHVRDLAHVEWRRRPPSPRILVYDGQRLWEHRPQTRLKSKGIARQAFTVVDPEHFGRYLPETILDHMLFSVDIPGLPTEAEYRSHNRLPDLFRSGRFHLADGQHTVDGAQCVAAEAADQEQIWFDPQLECAVRKRRWSRDGLDYEFVSRDFEKVTDGLWLPRTVIYTVYGHKEVADGSYFGKPVYRDVVQVEKMELNQPEHHAYFSIDVPPGAWVIDETLAPLDAKGDPAPFPEAAPHIVPSVSYIQPADQKDLEETIRRARRDASIPRGGENGSAEISPLHAVAIWLTAFSVGAAAVVLAGWGYRRMKGHRSRS